MSLTGGCNEVDGDEDGGVVGPLSQSLSSSTLKTAFCFFCP